MKGQDCLDGTHSFPFVSITVKDAIAEEVLPVFERLMLSRIGGHARDAQLFLYPVALFKMLKTGCENEFYVTFVDGNDLEGLRSWEAALCAMVRTWSFQSILKFKVSSPYFSNICR